MICKPADILAASEPLNCGFKKLVAIGREALGRNDKGRGVVLIPSDDGIVGR